MYFLYQKLINDLLLIQIDLFMVEIIGSLYILHNSTCLLQICVYVYTFVCMHVSLFE